MPKALPSQDFTVILVGNYEPDGQRSMFRFRDQLQSGLEAVGCKVALFNPPVLLGKFGAANHGIGKWIGYVDKYILAPFALKHYVSKIRGKRLVHVVDHSNAFYSSWIAQEVTVATCHDLLGVRSALGEFKENMLSSTGKQQQAMTVRGLKKTTYIASVSEATRVDVARLIGDEDRWQQHIPNALDAEFIAEASKEVTSQAKADLPESLEGIDYVMHIGGEKWYKNRILALKVFAEMHQQAPQIKLVIIGPSFSSAQLEAAGFYDEKNAPIIYLSGINDAELRAVYRNAQMLLFLSLIEGFGWPILEAQACGCAVATLDRAPMNELNAIPELILNDQPDEEAWLESAGATCLGFLQQPQEDLSQLLKSAKEFAAAYTNEASVEAYLELYGKALERRDS